jgi:hypothetical protein
MQQQRRRPGRPARELTSGERVPMSFRVPPELKRKMDQAAEQSGRSVAQEIEMRLNQSFERQGLLGEILDLTYRDPQLVALLLTMGEAMRDTLKVLSDWEREGSWVRRQTDWIDDLGAFDQVARAAVAIIEGARPSGDLPAATLPDGRTMPGESVAAFTMFRVAGNWSEPFPWLTAVLARGGKIIERFRDRWRRPERGRIAVVPQNWQDHARAIESLSEALSEPEDDGESAQ